MNISDKKKRISSITILLIGIIAVLYYIVIAQKVEFDSDFTDTVIWAKAMLTGNGIFDKNMSYAYTLPFGGSVLMAPFVAAFGVSYTAHVLGFILFFVISVISLYMLMKAMDFSSNESMIATGMILLLTLPSKEIRMTMWGHVIHYSLGFLFVVIGLIILSKIEMDNLSFPVKSNDKKNIFWAGVLTVFTALCCTNGLTLVLFFAIPLFGAVILERYIDTEKKLLCSLNINTLKLCAVCTIAGATGFVVSKFFQRDITTVYDSMFKTIPMWQHWVWDITERIRIFLICTCGEVGSEVKMESFSGLRIMFMALVGLTIIAVSFAAGISYKNIKNRIMKIFILSYYVLLFATLFVFDFSIARGTAHRLTGIYMMAVTVSVIYMLWLIRDCKLQRFGYLIAIIFAIAALFCIYGMTTLRGENRYSKLARVLEDNDLKYGYAEYWSAQVTTVLSNNRIEMASINIGEDGNVSKKEYNTFAEQFEDRADTDKCFVFLSSWEYDTIKNTLGNQAKELIKFDEDGYILVFDHNIF